MRVINKINWENHKTPFFPEEKLEEEKNKFELIKEKYTELKQQFNFSEEKEINLIK